MMFQHPFAPPPPDECGISPGLFVLAFGVLAILFSIL